MTTSSADDTQKFKGKRSPSAMRNGLLASFRRGFYTPHRLLAHFKGDGMLAIFMTQLEYWFEKKPNGFYKFQSKASHALYKNGQSWQEELGGLSEHRVRTLFLEIGVRYTDKSSLQKAKESGDLFNGKYYACYVNRATNVTTYYRNHALVDEFLYDLMTAGDGDEDDEPQLDDDVSAMFAEYHQATSGKEEKPDRPSVHHKSEPRDETSGAAPDECDVPPSPGQSASDAGANESKAAALNAELDTLFFPALSQAELALIREEIKTCEPEYRQKVLDEVEGQRRSSRGFTKSALRFTRYLIEAVENNQFREDLGVLVAAERQKRLDSEKALSAARNVSRTPIPPPADLPMDRYSPKLRTILASRVGDAERESKPVLE
ncbi:hypothetical protein [Noviherbaspirillum galbum]|uniref:Uncharacterized protein n=1 Tax=Noviherbaspirillum galbum TaxID=2709383 RepID=A0A6B3SVL7_9BURK|nr:hypothetical protein [Noviherbaspirillum galbum]NEX63435.1 hypothetical protein [Noviherbaspirillum galbum]